MENSKPNSPLLTERNIAPENPMGRFAPSAWTIYLAKLAGYNPEKSEEAPRGVKRFGTFLYNFLLADLFERYPSLLSESKKRVSKSEHLMEEAILIADQGEQARRAELGEVHEGRNWVDTLRSQATKPEQRTERSRR